MATLACTSDLTAGQQEGSKKQEARSKKQEARSKKQVLYCPIKTIFTESKKNGVIQ
jgi:hypothetical protein